MDEQKPKPKEYVCSFCEKPQRAVAQMVAADAIASGERIAICNECVSECLRLMLRVEKKALFDLKPKEETK